jgi:hypothetical protein
VADIIDLVFTNSGKYLPLRNLEFCLPMRCDAHHRPPNLSRGWIWRFALTAMVDAMNGGGALLHLSDLLQPLQAQDGVIVVDAR